VDFFGIGEHHTGEFPMPAGDVALAAIAARTERIRLGSAVTKFGMPGLTHDQLMTNIELYGHEVIPRALRPNRRSGRARP
jgi:hypothetical protein